MSAFTPIKARTLQDVLREIDAAKFDVTFWDGIERLNRKAFDDYRGTVKQDAARKGLLVLQGELLTRIKDQLGVSYSEIEERLN